MVSASLWMRTTLFSASTIGDTGPVSQSPDNLEMGIVMAKKYGNNVSEDLTAAMDIMIKQKGYDCYCKILFYFFFPCVLK